MKDLRIFPSLLSADLARLGQQADLAMNAGASGLHVDVMDYHYVPNLTFGPWICRALRNYGCQAFLDVHLMVEPVDALIQEFAKAGANAISFHPEASLHVDRSLQLIKDQDCQAGLVLNPATPLDCLDYVLDKLDFVLLMTVNPGFGGQSFIPAMLNKIQQTYQYLQKHQANIRLAVDGGVNLDNLAQLSKLGADTFIMGAAIFNEHGIEHNLQRAQERLKK